MRKEKTMALSDFKQTDPRWNTRPYAGENINNAGCGPTSMADIIAALRPEVLPPDVADWLQQHGFASNGMGTYWEGIPAGVRAFGGEGVQLVYSSMLGMRSSTVFDRFQEHLSSGYCGIMLMGNGGSPVKWTNGGHYIAAVGYQDGKVLIYDPASSARTGWHPWSDFIPSIKILYTLNIPSLTAPLDYAYIIRMRWLHLGSTGPKVRLLQKVWKAYGWYKNSIDGKYGDGTAAACRLGQQLNNLYVDESAGYDTQRATFRLVSSQDEKTGEYLFYARTVQKGSQGESVILLQCILKTDGYYSGAIDGDFGDKTDTALRSWQFAHGLKVDGQAAGETWEALIGF